MSPAKIVAPSAVIYVKEDETFDIYNARELAKLPDKDREILSTTCVVGESDGFILDTGSGDPIRVTTTSMSNIPPAHIRNKIVFEIVNDGCYLNLPEGTRIIPITNEQLAGESHTSSAKEI